KKDLDKTFQIHRHLEKAKDVLGSVMDKHSSEYEHRIDGKKATPEGYVVHHADGPFKIVKRRGGFSAANFNNAKRNPSPLVGRKTETQKPVVFAFGRMNPPTVGHGKVVDKVESEARKRGARHYVILSGSQDSKKNPLTQKQKLGHAHKFFPSA